MYAYGTSSGTPAQQSQNSQNSIVVYEGAGDLAGSNIYSQNILQINNYANTTLWKTILNQGGLMNPSGGGSSAWGALLWKSTSAINSIRIYDGTAAVDILAGSRFTLYGILAATP
jgi:hypothetical protein